jgi:hypothetical protein
MTHGPLALRGAGVVQSTAEVLNVLPRGKARPVGAVVVGWESLACFEIHVRNGEMKLGAVVIAVLRPDDGEAVCVHAWGQEVALETVDQLKAQFRFAFQSGSFLGSEAQNAGRVFLRELKRVDQLGGRLGIAA